MRSRRRHRELPLPRSFKREPREHWLDRYEREIDEHEEAVRKRVMQPTGVPAENNGDSND
jgi:hypothetical protein